MMSSWGSLAEADWSFVNDAQSGTVLPMQDCTGRSWKRLGANPSRPPPSQRPPTPTVVAPLADKREHAPCVWQLQILPSIIHHTTADQSVRHVCRVLEGITVVQHQIGHLSHLDTTETILDAQQPGRVQGDRLQGAL